MRRSVYPLLAVHFAASVTFSAACSLSWRESERTIVTESRMALYATSLALWTGQTVLIAVWLALCDEKLRSRLAIAAGLYAVQGACLCVAVGIHGRVDELGLTLGALLGLSFPAFLFSLFWRQVSKTRLSFAASVRSRDRVQFGLRHLFALVTGCSFILAAFTQAQVRQAIFSPSCLTTALAVMPLGLLITLAVLVLLSAKEDQFLLGMGEGSIAAAFLAGLGALLLIGLFSNIPWGVGCVFFVAGGWLMLMGTIWCLRQLGMRMTSVFDSI